MTFFGLVYETEKIKFIQWLSRHTQSNLLKNYFHIKKLKKKIFQNFILIKWVFYIKFLKNFNKIINEVKCRKLVGKGEKKSRGKEIKFKKLFSVLSLSWTLQVDFVKQWSGSEFISKILLGVIWSIVYSI